MTEIKLYNTRTRSKEVFTPIDPSNVRMYVCGPTVYDRAHIGNARPVVVFDVLFRLLLHVYGENAVTYVRNFTDVDDKINARAAETKRPGETELQAIRRITDETTRWYLEDMDALGALRPTHMPRATEHIGDMIAMIQTLIDRGHAYEREEHVLFDVPSWPGYGRLSRRSTDELLAGARVDVAPYKRSPMDFVLWKPSDPTLPGWDSPWGRGRPGWHIECSAMSKALLGEQFDIHGGGIDLVFPHHENELAQSCCANHTDLMANVWMHNGFLQVEGEKMSKSLGNFFTVKDLLDKGIPGEVIRFVLLSTKYTEPLDWTEERVREATATLRKWAAAADGASPELDDEVLDALADDLNTPEAIARIHELFSDDRRNELRASAQLLGFDLRSIAESGWAKPFHFQDSEGKFWEEGKDYMPTVSVMGWGSIPDATRNAALKLVHHWLKFRREKLWQKADELRDASNSIGIELRATRSPNGVNGGIANLNGQVSTAEIEELLQ